MKVCPKCQSTYSDASLNYCLSDGEPLVETTDSGGDSAVLRDDWRDAKTLIDPRLPIENDERRTSANHSAPTLPMLDVPTQSLSLARSNVKSYLIIGGLLAVVALIGSYLWYSQGKAPAANTANTTAAANQTPPAKPAVTLSADQQEKVKKEVGETLEAWRKSNEDRDLDKHLEFYANTLDYFYKDSNVNKNYVRAARARAYEVYQTLSLQIDKLKITPESETSAAAVFDKSWTFKNPQKTTTGSVQQELHLQKQNGKWLITGEKDLDVHFINNRTEQTDPTDPASANSANPTGK